ncbi:PEP-utilizing enzyme, partial [Bacillus cereus]|uniref:PEP-utilizing enzyme n=1 Tax=Bacillus cereus TaxID=1396 RepID=UPI002846F966
TDKDMIHAIEKAAAVVVEEGVFTRHAAVVGVSIVTPVIVGVNGVTETLKNGQEETVEAARGIVYNGNAEVV